MRAARSGTAQPVEARKDLLFPAPPRGLKGRTAELATLVRTLSDVNAPRVALVGAGGSGKSMLAAALAHRLAPRFPGGIHWFRVGAWDYRTLVEMLALRFGTSRERHAMVPSLRSHLRRSGQHLVVLDNHEDDVAMSRLLEALSDTNTTFIITARRCLLAGVLVFPVTAPLITSGRAAFPRVAQLTRTLRWNPLALDIADAIVGSKAATVNELARYLDARGISEVRVIDHEDDLPEVALLVEWAFSRLSPSSRRILGVLAHVEGDSVDVRSLLELSRAATARSRGRGGRAQGDPLAILEAWHLVQSPSPKRYAVHAVVRHAVRRKTEFSPQELFEHYVALLEEDPTRLVAEQTHLFAAMDHAHRTSDLEGMLRIEALLHQLAATRDAAR